MGDMKSIAEYESDPILSLCNYWLSADVMHSLLHDMRDEFFAEPEGEKTLWPEFQTYFNFWLSALYVVAEGFQELKLRSPTVQKKIAVHIHELRAFRNGTFHFQKTRAKQLRMFDEEADRINWAEDLHSSVGRFLKRHVFRNLREVVRNYGPKD
jgi:hypothetical protein